MYWDVPWHYEVLAQIYCLVLFAIKIFMKKVQRTDISAEYVNRVLVPLPSNDNEPAGKTAMLLCLKVAKDIAYENSILYLKTRDSTESVRSNILKTDPEEQNNFTEELYDFVMKNIEILKPPTLTNPCPRSRSETAITYEDINKVGENFINEFWKQISIRLEYTNTTDKSTSFSEAPAESFFSTWQFIVDHRPSLTIQHVIALCRIILEGPDAGTDVSHDLVKKAMEKWDSQSSWRKIHNQKLGTWNYI